MNKYYDYAVGAAAVIAIVAAITYPYAFDDRGEKNFQKFLKEHNCEASHNFGKPVHIGNANGGFNEVTPRFQRLYICGGIAVLD